MESGPDDGKKRLRTRLLEALGAVLLALGFVGIFLPPPALWIFIAPLVGAFLGEWLGGSGLRASGRAGLGAFAGSLAASMLKFLIVVYMAFAFSAGVFGLF